MKYLFSILAICFLFNLKAMEREVVVDTFLVNQEKLVNEQLKAVRASKTDEQRYLENESLKEMIESLIVYPGAFDYPFSSFQTMSTITSPDGAFRLFNWNIEDNSGLNSHFCYLIKPSRGGKPNSVIKFFEDRITIPPRPENMLTPRNWYGALYYNIIPVNKGNKTYYTILGYNGASRSTNKKIIDVFHFKGKKLRLGLPIFQEKAGSKRLLRRVFFEYSEKATIGVNMNERLEAIVFDHLVPETASLEGMYDYYVPDMSYDAYKWSGSIWVYQEDLVATNKENRKIRQYRPGEDGEDEFIEIKDDWITPVDNDNIVDGGNPIAPLETDEVDNKRRKRKGKKKKERKKIFKRKPKQPRSAITG